MIAKELRGAWWKFLLAIVVIVLLVPNLISYQEVRELAKQSFVVDEVTLGSGEDAGRPIDPAMQQEFDELRKAQETRDPIEIAAQQVGAAYLAGGFYVLFPLAALLGVGLISSEVSRGTVLLVLSRPVGRTRLLLTKYGVCAGILLAVVVVGGVLLVTVAGLRGYPAESLSGVELMFAGGSIWLASLFVLGAALLASVLFRSVIVSLAATAMLVFGILVYGIVLLEVLRYFGSNASVAEELSYKLWLPFYWSRMSVAPGASPEIINFLVGLSAAALPLLAALRAFRYKAL